MQTKLIMRLPTKTPALQATKDRTEFFPLFIAFDQFTSALLSYYVKNIFNLRSFLCFTRYKLVVEVLFAPMWNKMWYGIEI